MATAELTVQTNIIKSVRQDGGYGRKMSNRFAIGVPDLHIALPPFAPCVIEVKDFGEVNDRFDRQIDITPKQAHELDLIGAGYEDRGLGRVAFIVVALVHRGQHRLVLLPRQARRLSSAYEEDTRMWTWRKTGGYYDMGPLLARWSAARAVMEG